MNQRGQQVGLLNVSKCTVGFTASPTGGAGLVGGERGFLGQEGSWWNCWVEEESSLKQRWDEPGTRENKTCRKNDYNKLTFKSNDINDTDGSLALSLLHICMCFYSLSANKSINQLCLCTALCVYNYLQQGRLHGWVVEAAKRSWRGRGREGRYPRERQQARETATSRGLESTAQPATCTITCIRLKASFPASSYNAMDVSELS